MEESESQSVRSIKLVKVKGSYGTYLVQEKLTNEDKYLLIGLGIFILLAILF